MYNCQAYKVIKYIDHMPIELILYYYIMIAIILLHIMEIKVKVSFDLRFLKQCRIQVPSVGKNFRELNQFQ